MIPRRFCCTWQGNKTGVDMKRLFAGPLMPFLFAVAAVLYLAFCVKTVMAADVVLSWTNPTDTEQCTAGGPYDNPAGTRIWRLIADIPDPTADAFTLVGYKPGNYTFVATSYSTDGTGSRISGEADKTAFLEKLINNAPNVMLKPDFSEQTQSQEFYRTIGKPEEFSKY